MKQDLLDGAASAAAYTGLSRRKIYRLVEEGFLPHVKKGRRLFFRKSELDRTFRHRSRHDGSGRVRHYQFTREQWKRVVSTAEQV